MSLTPYVISGGEQVYEQPFACENCLFYGMVLPADKAALQKNVCDRFFNDPSGEPGRFVPAGPFVLLALCKLQKLVSETAPYSDWGAFAEQEVAFWVLTVDTKQDQLYFAFPYIWVDNAYALSMGREIYGFPKQLGQFLIPSDVNNAEHFSLDSLAITKLAPTSMGEVQPILEVDKTGPAGGMTEWASAAEAIEHVLKGSGILSDWKLNLKLMENAVEDLIHGTVPFAFLKQFRDVADSSKACYQAVIETNCKMTKWLGGGLLNGTYEVTLNDVESMAIRSDLGLSAGPVVPGIAFWCSFDFWIGPGQEIWKA